MLKTVKNIDLKITGLKILSKIGEGGMSEVYLAEQVSLKRKVAVKVMRLEIANNDLDVQRFKHEAKTIARLDHPNIINIYNIGQTANGEIFFTMPYLNHGDFSSYIIEDEQEFISMLKSICDGLSFAHERGVIHRDIKPENLLFDKFGNIRIADFGIAISKEGTRMTKEHQVVGSAQYMSPEQARSLTVDIHSDIYSLGIVIYERLTGNVPFDSDESITILVNHVSAEPEKLNSKMRHWQPLIDKCLAKSPNERFQSMLELKDALDKIPTNSIQRTNSSIKQALSGDANKHLKWVIPMLFGVIILTYFWLNRNSIDPIEVNELSIKTNQQQNNTTQPELDQHLDFNVVVPSKLVTKDSTETQRDSQIFSNTPDFNATHNTVQTDINIDASEISDSDQNVTDKQTTAMETITDASELLQKANENIKLYQLSRPRKNNATDQLLLVLSLQANNPEAILGLHTIGRKYYQLIDSAIQKYDFNTALKHLKSVESFNEKTNDINSKYSIQNTSLITSAKKLDLTNDDFSAEKVNTLARIIKILNPEEIFIKELELIATEKSAPKIGEKLLDDMGVETVLISRTLAVTTHEITMELYTGFANETKRQASKCRNPGGGFGGFFNSKSWKKHYFSQNLDHPVVCVTLADAQAYAQWLSTKTNNNYRLPTKQEWLNVASEDHNTFTACKSANLAAKEAIKLKNKEDNYSCSDSFIHTAPVESFLVNNLGMFDIHGNVSEWIQCNENPCKQPIAMGSSWFSGKQLNQLTATKIIKPNTGYTNIGFRLIRDL